MRPLAVVLARNHAQTPIITASSLVVAVLCQLRCIYHNPIIIGSFRGVSWRKCLGFALPRSFCVSMQYKRPWGNSLKTFPSRLHPLEKNRKLGQIHTPDPKGPFIATQLNSTELNSTDPVEQHTANQREASQSCFCLWRHKRAFKLSWVQLSCVAINTP